MTLVAGSADTLQRLGGATAATQFFTSPTIRPHESRQVCSAMLCPPLTRVVRINCPIELKVKLVVRLGLGVAVTAV